MSRENEQDEEDWIHDRDQQEFRRTISWLEFQDSEDYPWPAYQGDRQANCGKIRKSAVE